MIIATTKGNWNVFGIYLSKSDSIYIATKQAVETGNFDLIAPYKPYKIDTANNTIVY